MRRQTRIWLLLLLAVIAVARVYKENWIPSSVVNTVNNNPPVPAEETNEEIIENEAKVNIPERPVAEIMDAWGQILPVITNSTIFKLKEGSTIDWTIRKSEGQYEGTIPLSNGDLSVKGNVVAWGKWTLDMSNMHSDDWTGTAKGTDLKGASFFDVNAYPTATFDLIEVKEWTVKGILTMKGVSKLITFPATVVVENDLVVINAEFAIDRTQWGINGDDELISDYLEITLRLTWTS